jgi:predicted N-acetyltransferase YhbS
MNHHILDKSHCEKVAGLFREVFTASEGESEGQRIGDLAFRLASRIDDQEILCWGTYEPQALIGSIFFSRLQFSSAIQVYLLAPVAVSTAHQGKGVGQALIRQGLAELKKRSVAVAVTYGAPSFYSKVGFRILPEQLIQAPLRLSMPHGWLGQSLTDQPIPTLKDRPRCVREFQDPALW